MERIYAVPQYVVDKKLPGYELVLKELDPEVAYKYQNNGCNLSDLAKKEGLRTFDCALPIEWVREFEAKTGFNPVGHFVYDYTENNYGIPYPLTLEGKVAYKILSHVCGKIKLGD